MDSACKSINSPSRFFELTITVIAAACSCSTAGSSSRAASGSAGLLFFLSFFVCAPFSVLLQRFQKLISLHEKA